MTFAQMKKIEPGLAELESEAKAFKRTRCTITYWYQEIKPRLVYLVGWSRGQEAADRLFNEKHKDKVFIDVADLLAEPDTGSSDPLSSSQCYEVAYQHLYRLLPDCPAGVDCGDCITK